MKSWAIELAKSSLLEVQEYFRLCAAAAKASVSRPFYFHDLVEQIDEVMSSVYERDYMTPALPRESDPFRTPAELAAHVVSLQDQMKSAAANLDFEKAAALRDEIKRLRNPELSLPRVARRA